MKKWVFVGVFKDFDGGGGNEAVNAQNLESDFGSSIDLRIVFDRPVGLGGL